LSRITATKEKKIGVNPEISFVGKNTQERFIREATFGKPKCEGKKKREHLSRKKIS